jgi:ubiquinone biosynthesis protein COQ4
MKRAVRALRILALPLDAALIVLRPSRIQGVLKVSETLFNERWLTALKRAFEEKAPEALQSQPLLHHVSIDELLKYPQHSLAFQLGHFLKSNQLSLKSLPQKTADTDFAFLFNHFYSTHDVWHLLTGYDTSLKGELSLQSFYAAQAPTPLAIFLIGLGLMRSLVLGPDPQDLLDSVVAAYNRGKKAKPLFGIDWNVRLSDDFGSLQKELGLSDEARSLENVA